MDDDALLALVGDDAGLRQVVRSSIARVLQRDRLRIAPSIQPFRALGVGHFHASPELFLQVSGACDMQLAGGRIRSQADDLLLIPRGVAHHEYPVPAGSPFLNLVFSYSDRSFGVHAAAGHPFGSKSSRIIHRLTLASSRVPRLVGYLNDAAGYLGDGLPVEHPAILGLVRAHLALLDQALAEGASADQQADHLVLQARQQISVHLTDPLLSVAWLARRLRCSADYLSHRFSSVSGVTLSRFIASERCELARRLLADAALSVSEIAVACGFADPAYFSRVFKAQVGLAPRAYRRSLG
jgi:AraC-like DNA-binding protein